MSRSRFAFRPAALLAGAALSALPLVAHADFSYSVGAFSDYRFRGISQTRLKPAIQASVDWSHDSGFYLGAWVSTIRWIKDAYGDANVEIDLYGGYKGQLIKDTLSYDVGVLQYVYPGARTSLWNASYKNPNTTEIYGALTFGPATAKVSYAPTNLFGNYDFARRRDSKGSYYAEIAASFDVGAGIMLTPHAGYQRVTDIDNASYTDYSLALSKDFNGFVPSIAVVGTNANRQFYVPGGAANSTKYLGRTGVVVGLKYNF